MNTGGILTVILFICSAHFSTESQSHSESVLRNTHYAVYSYAGYPGFPQPHNKHQEKNLNFDKTLSFGTTPPASPPTLNYEIPNQSYESSNENNENPEISEPPLDTSSSTILPSISLLEKLFTSAVTNLNLLLPQTVKKLIKSIFNLVAALLNIPFGSVDKPALNDESAPPTLPLNNDILRHGVENSPKYLSPDALNSKKINDLISHDNKELNNENNYDYNPAWTPFLTNSLSGSPFNSKENIKDGKLAYTEQSSFTNNEKPFINYKYSPNVPQQFPSDANKLITEYSVYGKPLSPYYNNDNGATSGNFGSDHTMFSGNGAPYSTGPRGYPFNAGNEVYGNGLLASYYRRPQQYLF